MSNNHMLKLNIKKVITVLLIIVLLLSSATSFGWSQTDNPDFKLTLKEVDYKERTVLVDVISGKGVNLAAGTFLLEYNTKHMTCISSQINSKLSSNVMLNETIGNGGIRFTYLNMAPISDEIVIMTLKFKINENHKGKTYLKFKEKDAVGYDFNQLTLDYHDLNFNAPGNNPFTDVKSSDWFYSSVIWALDNGITTGVSATSFGPTAQCTRGQVVTFLWRAAGEPEPTSTRNPFSDVSTNQYYAKAVLWAYENGITTGTSSTRFSPDATVNRAQFVTFLWRLEGKEAATINNPFRDVMRGQYYYDAVLWAYSNGITTGNSATTFAPNNNCLRQEVVTFLYRNFN